MFDKCNNASIQQLSQTLIDIGVHSSFDFIRLPSKDRHPPDAALVRVGQSLTVGCPLDIPVSARAEALSHTPFRSQSWVDATEGITIFFI